MVLTTNLAFAHLRAAEVGRDGERYLVADTYASLPGLAREIGEQAALTRTPPAGPAWLFRPLAAASEWAARVGFEPLVTRGELSWLLWEARVDASKAMTELGFRPTPLPDGVAQTLESFAAQGWWNTAA